MCEMMELGEPQRMDPRDIPNDCAWVSLWIDHEGEGEGTAEESAGPLPRTKEW